MSDSTFENYGQYGEDADTYTNSNGTHDTEEESQEIKDQRRERLEINWEDERIYREKVEARRLRDKEDLENMVQITAKHTDSVSQRLKAIRDEEKVREKQIATFKRQEMEEIKRKIDADQFNNLTSYMERKKYLEFEYKKIPKATREIIVNESVKERFIRQEQEFLEQEHERLEFETSTGKPHTMKTRVNSEEDEPDSDEELPFIYHRINREKVEAQKRLAEAEHKIDILEKKLIHDRESRTTVQLKLDEYLKANRELEVLNKSIESAKSTLFHTRNHLKNMELRTREMKSHFDSPKSLLSGIDSYVFQLLKNQEHLTKVLQKLNLVNTTYLKVYSKTELIDNLKVVVETVKTISMPPIDPLIEKLKSFANKIDTQFRGVLKRNGVIQKMIDDSEARVKVDIILNDFDPTNINRDNLNVLIDYANTNLTDFDPGNSEYLYSLMKHRKLDFRIDIVSKTRQGRDEYFPEIPNKKQYTDIQKHHILKNNKQNLWKLVRNISKDRHILEGYHFFGVFNQDKQDLGLGFYIYISVFSLSYLLCYLESYSGKNHGEFISPTWITPRYGYTRAHKVKMFLLEIEIREMLVRNRKVRFYYTLPRYYNKVTA